MVGPSRADAVVEFILSAIEAGTFRVGDQLPGESDLAELSGASRLTVREAVKVLAAQRVLEVLQGRGTFVAPVEQWLSVDALMRVQGANQADVMGQLLDVRGYLEVGAAERFATLVTDEQLDQLRRHLSDMVEAHSREDVPRMVAADLAFHDVILNGCQNPFLIATLQPLARSLVEARRETSKYGGIREHAIDEHRKVLLALEARDRVAARKAMRSHMRQTQRDTQVHFNR